MHKNKYSTTDLHNIKSQIYLGFLSQNFLQSTQCSYDISFFGGEPEWLQQPNQQIFMCSQCNIKLSFFGQIYCPLDAEYCYHRILYILFCDKCLRQYKCLRQQATKQWLKSQIKKTSIKKFCQPRQLESDSFSKNEFLKIMNNTKRQCQQEFAIQQADSQAQQDIYQQTYNQQQKQILKNCEKTTNQKQQEVKEKIKNQTQINSEESKDLLFQVYKKSIKQLGDPCILYTDVPLNYNKKTLNPRHFCKQCGSKLSLEVQITERILSLQNNPNSKLLLADWGSIMIYTCSVSCNQSQEQSIVIQYQIDAIKQQDIKKLEKNKKNKKKKQKSKQKKSKSNEKNIEQQKLSNENHKQVQEKQQGQGQGDWD